MSLQHSASSSNLLEVLEKILDKGVVIAGDIKVSLADIELLCIKIRLIVASVDKAKEIGIDWWEHDSYFSSQANKLKEENNRLRERLNDYEQFGRRELPLDGQ